jgi:hypothetical protein
MSKAGRPKNKIAGQFSARTIEMMESPAYRALSIHAHRILSRLEIEHAYHGGNENGRLPVTYATSSNMAFAVTLSFQRYENYRHSDLFRSPSTAAPATPSGVAPIISGSPIAMSAMPSRPTNGSTSKAKRRPR